MAAHSLLVVSALLLCCFLTGCCQDIAGPTQISISPSSLVMTPNVSDTTGGQVTVTCRPSSTGAGETLVVMNIERVSHSNPNAAPVPLAAASSTGNNGNAVLAPNSPQAKVSGSISQRVIILTLTRASCGDGGMYICKATTLTAVFQAKLYSNSANVTVQVSPGPVVMIAEPSGTTNWRVNQTLLMRCNGIVGTVSDDSKIEWFWEYQDGTAGFDNWQSYSMIGNPDTDISNGPIESSGTSNNCYKRQTSELTRYLTVDDTGRQYRCYVNNRDVSSQSVDYAQVYDVGTVTASTTTTTTTTTTTSAPRAEHHDVVCGPTSISFNIPVSDLLAADVTAARDMSLSDPRCRVDMVDRHLRGSTNLNDCGTTLQVTNDSLVYSNAILLPQVNDSGVTSVIPIQCRYDRLANRTVSAYLPVVRQVLFTETGVGQLSFRINQYRDATFAQPVADSAYPLRLRSSDDVFVSLSLDGDQKGLGMDVVGCMALPSSSPATADANGVYENLIENNCPASPDVRLLNDNFPAATQNHSLFRFSFKAVTFPDPSDPQRSRTGVVYIHCRVRLCKSSDCRPDGQCPASSALSRSRRSVGGLAEGSAGHQLSTGPLLVEGDSTESNASSPLVIFLGVVAACATLVAMVATVAWRRSRRGGDHQRLDKVTADVQ